MIIFIALKIEIIFSLYVAKRSGYNYATRQDICGEKNQNDKWVGRCLSATSSRGVVNGAIT